MVTLSWYLVTHLEIIKDGVLILVNFQGYLLFHLGAILDSGQRKNGNQTFSES